MSSSSVVRPLPRENGKAEHVVVIAASAGGIEGLKAVLAALPPDFPAAILIVQHRTVGRPGVLRQILQRETELSVKDATPDAPLKRGVVYVTPADRHTRITNDLLLSMEDHRKINFLHASADPLFESAAEAFGRRAIAVVLSGRGRNGAAGARAIRDAGGVVIAQDKATSQYFGMPHAAIEAGAATDILPIDRIATCLNSLVDHSRQR